MRGTWIVRHISIHVPLTRYDEKSRNYRHDRLHFNPRTSHEVRRWIREYRKWLLNFNPRTSHEVRPIVLVAAATTPTFQSTYLSRGTTAIYSNNAPISNQILNLQFVSSKIVQILNRYFTFLVRNTRQIYVCFHFAQYPLKCFSYNLSSLLKDRSVLTIYNSTHELQVTIALI